MVDSVGREPAIRLVMMPRDTNSMGSIFGGHILSLIDLAAGEHARSIAPKLFVTKVMREVEFIQPVFVGDLVSFYTSTVRTGRTSVTIKVEVESRRRTTRDGDPIGPAVPVTCAEVVMVAVDKELKPTPIAE